ncbi:DUF2924 domain-containing protein [Maioricimonas sp. JC845]|uniref:DUF2924 domain-containing protein n=1 Tax=Maioricimonas sp. JC845 TaxID=3232138 RepID=UPI00345840A3
MATADSIAATAAPEREATPGTLTITEELARLQGMTVGDLKQAFARLFGEEARSGNRQWLIKRIAWRIQANAEGDLSERARRRALELADDADLRMKAPCVSRSSKKGTTPVLDATRPLPAMRDERLPTPGNVLTRVYKGKTIIVTVRTNGLEYEGTTYRSLSAVARAVTGTHWNGYHFFGLRRSTDSTTDGRDK